MPHVCLLSRPFAFDICLLSITRSLRLGLQPRRPLTHSLTTHSLTTHSLTFTYSFTHSLIHSFTHSLIHSSASITHSLTHTLTHPLTRFLISIDMWGYPVLCFILLLFLCALTLLVVRLGRVAFSVRAPTSKSFELLLSFRRRVFQLLFRGHRLWLCSCDDLLA